jgi:hypothetical protein
MYYDSTDGYYLAATGGSPASQKRFVLGGYYVSTAPGAPTPAYSAANPRYPSTALTTSSRPIMPTANTTYAVSMRYDGTVDASASTSNIRMDINDSLMKMGYWYSVGASTSTGFGAWGQPASSDGTGTCSPYNSTTTDYIYNIFSQSSLQGLLYNKLCNTTASNFNRTIMSVYIGSTIGSAVSSFQGDIAEIIMYATPLSDPDIVIINKYLVNKYGITPW